MRAKNSLVNGSVAGLAIFLLIVLPLAAQAGVQTTVVVDGQYDEWDLDKNCSTPMHSDQGCAGEALPKVYLHYDNIANMVFVLVLQTGGMQMGKDDPVMNIYSLGDSIPTHLNGAGKIANFSWVMDGSIRVGWEGSFRMIPEDYQCDTPAHTRAALKKKTASEVEVIDTEDLLFDCD